MERARRHQRLLSGARVRAARARRRARRPQPDPPGRLRPPRRRAELRAGRLLPGPARRREGRRSRSCSPGCSGASLKAHAAERAARRLLGARARRLPRCGSRSRRGSALSFFVAHLGDLPRPGRRRGRRRRPLAAALAVAALVGAARIRRAQRPLRARLERRARAGSPTTRSMRRPPSSGRAAPRRPRRAARLPAADRARPLLRAASSDSPSRAVRLRSLPDLAVAP